MDELTRRCAAKIVTAGVAVGAAGLAVGTTAAQGQKPARDLKQTKERQKAAAALARQWFTTNVGSAQEAADFVNLAPAQTAGEVSITARSDGTYDVFYYL